MGCCALLQGIFLTQGSNPCLLWLTHCRGILYHWAAGEALVFLFSGLITICLKYLFPSPKAKMNLLSSILLDLSFLFVCFVFLSTQIPSSLQWQRVMSRQSLCLPFSSVSLQSYSPTHILSGFWNNHVLFPGILFPLYQPGKLLCTSVFSVKTECLETCRFLLCDGILRNYLSSY